MKDNARFLAGWVVLSALGMAAGVLIAAQVVTLAVTQALNFILVWPLQHAGLALAIGLGACLNAALLLRGLRSRDIYFPQPGWSVFTFKLALAVYAMAAVLWRRHPQLDILP